MEITLKNPEFHSPVTAPSSKSEAQRLLIASALSDNPSRVICPTVCEDINATVRCLCALGAEIKYNSGAGTFDVVPIPADKRNKIGGATLDCGESGATFRFLLPVAAALGGTEFVLRGSLCRRPNDELYKALSLNGASISVLRCNGNARVICSGELMGGEYSITGAMSSQYISGLMFALPLVGDNNSSGAAIKVLGESVSEAYIKMTRETISRYGIKTQRTEDGYSVATDIPYHAPEVVTVGGDWSGAAFPICAAAIGKSPVTVKGLDLCSLQPDMEILNVLKQAGAIIMAEKNGGGITVFPSSLRGFIADAAKTPDIIPPLAVVAAHCYGLSIIQNATHLRTKECDRLAAIFSMLASFGVKGAFRGNTLTIFGKSRAAEVRPPMNVVFNPFGDHRMAMAASLFAFAAETQSKVTVLDAQVVGKSYPGYWESMEKNK